MNKEKKVYSGYDDLPDRMASDVITEGCIALEGGAFRGVYGEGVLDALMDADINMQCTVGVSAGAMNGFNYVAGHIGRAARINLKYRHDKRYVGKTAFLHNKSVIGFDFALDQVTEDLPFNYDRFYSSDRRFVAVATSVDTGETEYFEKGTCRDIWQAIRASASMPYVSKPVMVDGIPCLDGGCSVKVPYQWALDQNYEKVVVVMTREISYRRDENSKTDTMARVFYHRHPAFTSVQSSSSHHANEDYQKIEKLAEEGRIFLIAPSQHSDVSRLEKDMEKLGDLYYQGYADGENAVPALKQYLRCTTCA